MSAVRSAELGPTVAIVNMATGIADHEVTAAVAALQVQVDRDFAPVWFLGANLIAIASGHAVPPGAWVIYLLDKSDQEGDLGYHDKTAEGLPLAKVFTADDKADGLSWTVTLSHELLEMLLDPYLNLATAVLTDDGQLRLYAQEACDPVEDDVLGYEIAGVRVSDFLLPARFDPAGRPGVWCSFRGHVTTPFALAAGGYISVCTAGPAGVTGWEQKMAETTGPRALNKRATSRTMRRTLREVPVS